MPTSRLLYKGDLRTELVHEKSGDKIYTDAPIDNHGKGQAFSPTDLLATSLASCMLTVMGIKANQLSINLEGSSATVVKTMASNPRRVAEIDVELNLPNSLEPKHKTILERTALECPVSKSLSNELIQRVKFNYTN